MTSLHYGISTQRDMAPPAKVPQESALSRNGLLCLGMVQESNRAARIIIIFPRLKSKGALSRCWKEYIRIQHD